MYEQPDSPAEEFFSSSEQVWDELTSTNDHGEQRYSNELRKRFAYLDPSAISEEDELRAELYGSTPMSHHFYGVSERYLLGDTTKHLSPGKRDLLVAWDRKLNIPVAIKKAGHPNLADVNKTEARLTAQKSQYDASKMVRIYDYLEEENALVLEYLQAPGWNSLKEHPPMPPSQLAIFIANLAEAVESLDTLRAPSRSGESYPPGHFDINPGNIFVGDQGEVKILDFGLLSWINTSEMQLGTPGYVSPEHLRLLGDVQDVEEGWSNRLRKFIKRPRNIYNDLHNRVEYSERYNFSIVVYEALTHAKYNHGRKNDFWDMLDDTTSYPNLSAYDQRVFKLKNALVSLGITEEMMIDTDEGDKKNAHTSILEAFETNTAREPEARKLAPTEFIQPLLIALHQANRRSVNGG